MARVRGIGGFFFRSKHPDVLAQWYEKNLGITSIEFSGPWNQDGGPTVFAPFPEDTDYFGTRGQTFMLNFRVDNLDVLLSHLRESKVRVDDNIISESVGRFAWIYDPDGNKIELWEPSVKYE